jgi:hypothetical protein
MFIRHDEHEAVGSEWECLKGPNPNYIGSDSDVGEPGCNRGDDLLTGLLLEVHIDSRVSRQEASQRLGQVGQSRSIRQHTYVAAKPLRVLPQIAAHLLELTQYDPCVVCESLSGRCRAHAAGVPVEQWHAARLLHATDPRACGGKRQGSSLCPMCDAFSLHNVEKQPQVRQVEAHRSILEKGVTQVPSFRPKADPSYFHIVSCAHSPQAARMKANSGACGSEVFLSIVTIRLAAAALLGFTLLVLPARPRDLQLACLGPGSTEPQLQAAPATGQPRVNDEALRDMILHD